MDLYKAASSKDQSLRDYANEKMDSLETAPESELKALVKDVKALMIITKAVQVIIETLKAGDWIFSSGEKKGDKIENGIMSVQKLQSV